jgi:predicted unusual protein kinase regulating ubiquinone biosynthesis (AarF/ABC1/UbiB family)
MMLKVRRALDGLNSTGYPTYNRNEILMTNFRGPVPPQYDPDRLAAEAEAQGLRYWTRMMGFGWALLMVMGWMALIYLTKSMKTKVAFARWARIQMIHYGAVFIKLGQMLSTRVDAFPPEVLDELSHLQDKVPSFPVAEARAIIEADLGQPLLTTFSRFDDEPLAAASMGQVHTAALPDGQEVVVKILRPRLAEGFALDLTLMRRFAVWVVEHPKLIRFVGGSPDTPWITLVDRLGISMYQQLDLWTEGLHGEKFARNFAENPRVSAPAIYWEQSSTRLLTQERIYGFRFDEEHKIRAAGLDYLEIAEVVIRAFTKQVFEDCFFHADSHPGNLFVTPEGNIVYLDFGMVEYIDEAFQTQLIEMFIHVIQQDWPTFVEDMVKASIVPEEAPREELLPIFADVFAAQLGFTAKRYTLQEVSDKFYAIVRRYPFRLPERFLFLTRTAASLVGVVYRADPGFKLLPIALPFFAKMVLSRVDGENPWIIQEALRAAESGGSLERMLGIVKMAIADEPEQMVSVAKTMVEVALHPKAEPLRQELQNRLLSGSLAGMENLIPDNFALGTETYALIETFLRSAEGRQWAISLLEDKRFPALVSRFVTAGKLPREMPIDVIGLFLEWFPHGAERQRAFGILHDLMASEDFPWHTLSDPMQMVQLQMTSTVPRAQHIPALIEFLGQRRTLPIIAKGVFKGFTDRLSGRGTGPLLGDPS